MHIPKWVIVTAVLAGVVMIAAIAFFIGRESSRPPAAIAAPASAPPEQEPSPTPAAPLNSETTAAAAPLTTPPVTPSSSNQATPSSGNGLGPAAEASASQPAAEARARVAAYFAEMNALQSAGAAGDQQEFATTVVNAATSGDFSGIDSLIRAAADTARRAAAIQPPSECADYHRQAVALLEDSRTMITAIRDGLKRNDADALTAMAASAQSMKSRADDLAKAEQALRARFGL